MNIKILSDNTINKISAGEVIERPASVVKELVENSIDAGATKIDITLEQAGKNLIIITDNGAGMPKEDLELAIQRHATSKLDEDDLLNIHSFGFRGEALPSIGAISKFKITSKSRTSEFAYSLSIHGGNQGKTSPAHLNEGTSIEVRDLFFATPARLKFLRTDKTELMAVVALVKKIALSHPHISFTLTHEGRELIKVRRKEGDFADILKARITDIMGEEFLENSAYVNLSRDDLELFGYTSIPTYNRASAEEQFLFINNRPVKDKILNIALKIAYQDFLARDRHPISALFLKIDPHLVDVNVHPAKTEVRFHDPNLVREIFISAIKDALRTDGQRVSSTLGAAAINYMIPENYKSHLAENEWKRKNRFSIGGNLPQRSSAPYSQSQKEGSIQSAFLKQNTPVSLTSQILSSEEDYILDTPMNETISLLPHEENKPLGRPIAQLHNTYIISQTADSVIITDQHAAHERLGYEKIKDQIRQNGLIKQRLLIPEIVELSTTEKAEIIADSKTALSELGLTVEKFGENSIIVSEIPNLLGEIDIKQLINDLADHLLDMGENLALSEIIEHVTETYACHYAVRAGRKLAPQEMDSLLRQMESTDFSAQCNHGRPTYVKLQLKDIEKLFGRR